MDNSVMGGELLPGSNSGMLDLDPSIHHRHHQQHHHMQSLASTMPGGGGLDANHPINVFEPSRKGLSINSLKGKAVSPSANNTSEDDEDQSQDNDNDAHFNGSKTKKGSPWQRMKWTDDMVRILITVVSCVGDDGTPEATDGPVRRKSGAVLQKKGKWKTVSKLMLEKGCYVSPQQCEDKFNDLNKRYKRLNEILGRGTTCRVVENPTLLDTMPHISAKAKEDVKKILSSKHLFYREMCAYHNGQSIPNAHDLDLQVCTLPVAGSLRGGNGFGDEEEDDEEEDEDNGDDEERSIEFGKRGHDSFRVEIDGVLQDSTKSPWEQREWFRKRALQLHEERVEIQAEAFELEKRRFKWRRFCGKKDRELERLRLDNEKLRLENEQMVMQVRQKEIELDLKSSGEPLDLAGFGLDREQGRDQIELGRVQ